MKTIIFLALYILLPGFVDAQITVSGRILDAETRKNVEYATVSVKNRNLGTYTDSLGNFILSSCDNSDTLIIKHIAYNKAVIPVTYFLHNSAFLVTPEPMLLGDVIVAPKRNKEYKIGCTHCNSNSSLSSFRGYEVATYIKSDINTANSFIKEIVLCVKKEKASSFYIKTHLYVNENNMPGDEIKYNNLHFLKNEKGMIKIDLSNYMIPFPSGGLFVGIEWLGTEPERNPIESGSVSPRFLISDKPAENIAYYRFWDLPWKDLSSLIGKPEIGAQIGLTIIK